MGKQVLHVLACCGAMALGEGADIAHILAALERGTVMTRFLNRKKANWMFYLRTDTFEVLQYVYPEKKKKHVAKESSVYAVQSSCSRAIQWVIPLNTHTPPQKSNFQLPPRKANE